ncbi:31012_t:CDS:1, partial [Racocetra persica]
KQSIVAMNRRDQIYFAILLSVIATIDDSKIIKLREEYSLLGINSKGQ